MNEQDIEIIEADAKICPDKKNQNQDASANEDVNVDVFKNRRKMAWLSLVGIFSLTILLIVFLAVVFAIGLYNPEAIEKLTEAYKTYLDWSGSFIGWTYATLSGIILAYFGVAAYYYSSRKDPNP